jgi:thiol-disulfide isomerase/thioredoxin
MRLYVASTLRVLALSWLVSVVSPALYGIDRGEPAPKFTAKTLDGERITNDTVEGKTCLIQFWTTWCRYCRQDQPAVDELARKYASAGLVVVAVNVGESRKKVQAYLETSPREGKIVLMEDTNLAAVLHARGFPFYVAIDAKGRVAGVQSGSGGRESLVELLDRAGLRVE